MLGEGLCPCPGRPHIPRHVARRPAYFARDLLAGLSPRSARGSQPRGILASRRVSELEQPEGRGAAGPGHEILGVTLTHLGVPDYLETQLINHRAGLEVDNVTRSTGRPVIVYALARVGLLRPPDVMSDRLG